MLITHYTKDTLPRAYFPDNFSQVNSRQRQLNECTLRCGDYATTSGTSAFAGFTVSAIISLSVTLNLPGMNLILLSLPILIVVPSIVSPIIMHCYYKNKSKKLEILVRDDHKKLSIPAIRHIYSKESNPQKPVFENLLGDQITVL